MGGRDHDKGGGIGSSGVTDQIESLLQRLKRQSSEGDARPPDEASAAVGRRLGASFALVQEDDCRTQLGDKILEALVSSSGVNPSVPHAYFGTLSSRDAYASSQEFLLECLPRWILRCEDVCLEQGGRDGGACFETLSAAIRTYAVIFHQNTQSENSNEDMASTVHGARLADTFHRLRLTTSRTCLIRHFTRVTFSGDMAVVRFFLSPLLAACVLTLSTPFEVKALFLEALWREYRVKVRSGANNDGFIDILSWMTKSLHLFLLGVPGEPLESQSASMELAYRWLVQLTDVASHLAQSSRVGASAAMDALSNILSEIVRDILPHFTTNTISSTRFQLDSVLSQLLCLSQTRGIQPLYEPVALFRLSIMTLSTPVREDVYGLLSLLAECDKAGDLIKGMTHTLACIYAHDDMCRDAAKTLRWVSSSVESLDLVPGRVTNIIQLLHKHRDDEEHILQAITPSTTEEDIPRLSAVQQNAALLLGISLLLQSGQHRELIETFLKRLLQNFPHLGIPLLPVVMNSIQESSHTQHGRGILSWLEFLCVAVVHDPHCAQEVWNLVGVTLAKPDTPMSVRSAVIRLYPRLCRRNKRLCRRVCDSLGGVIGEGRAPTEMRLAVAATIADLAREDRIRDVSDVIGWIQTFLSDENPSVVHLAIMSLHHLVVAQELDFDVVIKVLNKRLCPVTVLEEVLKLPDVALEALVLLLGDGECDVESSSDDDENSDHGESSAVSAQVASSVRVLIQLAMSPELSSQSEGETRYSADAISRIRRNVYKALSNYTLDALGVDDDGLRSVMADRESGGTAEKLSISETGERYLALSNVILDGIRTCERDGSDLACDSVVDLTKKLIEYEEETLGSTLWRKGGKVSAERKTRKTKASKSSIAALPDPATVRKFYDDHPSTATAISLLLCFETEQFSNQSSDCSEVMARLSDIASDISNDTSDPIVRALAIQGWLRAMSQVWSSIAHSTDQPKGEALDCVIGKIREWREVLEDADNTYLALACFAFFVPDTFTEPSGMADIDMSHYIDEIYNELQDAYKGHQFERNDTAHVCFGIMGVRALNSSSMSRVDEILDLLESSAQGYDVHVGFGTHYGLALIAQALPDAQKSKTYSPGSDPREISARIGRILAVLMSEVLSCLDSKKSTLVNLVACLKSGKPTPDLVSSISVIEESSLLIHNSMTQKTMSLCLSLALCVPALSSVSADLLLSSYRLLERLPWGCSKGLAIPSSLLACQRSGLLSKEDVDNVLQDCTSRVKDADQKMDTEVADDILYALTSLANEASSSESDAGKLVASWTHRILGDADSLQLSYDGRPYSMVTAAVSLGSVPCLASGAPLFYLPAQLNASVGKESVTTSVGLLSNLANRSDDVKCSEAASLGLGLLSSMKLSPSDVQCLQSSPMGRIGAATESTSERTPASSIDFSRVPGPQGGTMLAQVLDLIQRFCLGTGTMSKGANDPHASLLPRLLRCLTGISLPSQFATNLLEPILNDAGIGTDDAKAACLELLISQIGGRRRAAFDGREFVNLAMRSSLLPSPAFRSKLGDTGARVFLSGLPQILPKFPTDALASTLENLWLICSDVLTGDSATRALAFLSSLRVILHTSRTTALKGAVEMSPRTITVLRRFVVDTVFRGLCSEECSPFLVEETTKVLKEIPIAVLDEMGFLSSQLSAESMLRVTCTMGLVRDGYFDEESGRASSEVTKAVAWLARQQVSPKDEYSYNALRRVAFDIALAARGEVSASRQDMLLLLLEAMLLVHGSSRSICLEFLGMLLGVWCNGRGSDAEFSLACLFVQPQQNTRRLAMLSPSTVQSISGLLMHDLPWNLGAFCRAERLSKLVANRVWRICKTWSEQGADPGDIRCLRRIFSCCRVAGTETSEQDYASLATLLLTTPT